MTDASRYLSHIFWSDEDGGYIAVAPDVPGCSAFGETQQAALAELHDAVAAWIEAARAAGNPIPEPSRPAAEDTYSGKILVRMPKALHAQIAKQAKKEDVSLNQYMVFLLTLAVTQHAHSVWTINAGFQVLREWSKLPWKPDVSDKLLVVSNLRTTSEGGSATPLTLTSSPAQ